MSEPQAIRTPLHERVAEPVRFGPFEFRLETGRLTRLGMVRRLEKQPATMLAHLIECRDRLVTRTELIQLLWPSQEHGDFEHRLDKVVAKLRFALSDDAAQPKFVETLRGRGFRFVTTVTYPICPSRRATDDVEIGFIPAEQSPERENLDSPDPQAAVGLSLLADRRRDNKARLGYFIAVGLVAALVVGFGLRERSRDRPRDDGATRTSTVVVLGMRPSEDSGEDTWISRATANWLAEDIYGQGQLRVLSGAWLTDLNSALPLSSDKGLSRQTLDRIRSRVGADFVVFGTYTVQKRDSVPVWQVELSVQNTRQPDSIQRASVMGPQTDGPSLLESGRDLLWMRLGLGGAADKSAGIFQARLPENPAAARLYAEGILAIQHLDMVEASALLTQASAVEPDHGMTHALLAMAWTDMGYQNKAAQELELALQKSRSMTSRQQAELLALRCRITGDFATAANVYETLAREHPQDLDYRLQTASEQIAGGASTAALKTLAGIPEGPGPGLKDAEIMLARSLAEAGAGEYEKQFDYAARAESSAKASGQPLLMAKALAQEGSAQFTLGNWSAAQGMWQKALDVFAGLGDRRGMANVFYQQGKLFWDKRESVTARQAFERSIELSQPGGNDPNLAAAYASLANVIMYSNTDPRGTVTQVVPLLAKASNIYKQLGNTAGQGTVLGTMGDLFVGQSHYEQARETYTRAMELSKAANDRSSVANRLLDLGIVASWEGDNAAAERLYAESLEDYITLGQKDRIALVKNRLAVIYFREDRLDEAIRLGEESLQMLKSIGYVYNGELEDLSRFEMERNPARAESYALESLDASTDKIDTRGISGRYMVLAEAQLAEGKLQDAKVSIQHAFDLQPVLIHRIETSEMLWARAEVSLREGKLKDTRSDLDQALHIAESCGSKPNEMQVRLSLAEIDMQGLAPSARAELVRIERESQKLDLLLIARKAKADLLSIGSPV